MYLSLNKDESAIEFLLSLWIILGWEKNVSSLQITNRVEEKVVEKKAFILPDNKFLLLPAVGESWPHESRGFELEVSLGRMCLLFPSHRLP